jgi:hypothetical protein
MSEFFSVVIYLPALLGDFVISIWIANWDKPDHSSEIGKLQGITEQHEHCSTFLSISPE